MLRKQEAASASEGEPSEGRGEQRAEERGGKCAGGEEKCRERGNDSGDSPAWLGRAWGPDRGLPAGGSHICPPVRGSLPAGGTITGTGFSGTPMSSIAATPREGDSGYSYEGSSAGSHSPLELAVEWRMGGERVAMVRSVCAVRPCQTERGLRRSAVRSRGLVICGSHGQAVVTSHVRDVTRVGKRERLRIVSGSVDGGSDGSRRRRAKPRRRVLQRCRCGS